MRRGTPAWPAAPQSGKSTLLRTLICSLALLHTPQEIQFYCLDFGGGTLGALTGLPHVGGVATRLQAERVRRTVAEVRAILERREQEFAERGIESIAAYRAMRASGEISGDGFGDVFLVIDGWLTLRQEYEQLELDITALAARGLGYGIHVMAATSKWSEFRPAIRDLLGTRFELRLGDPYESEMGRTLAANVPERTPGRGLTRDGLHFLTALPRIDGQPDAASLSGAVRKLTETVDSAWQGPRAPQVRLLPGAFSVTELPGPAETGARLPFAVDEATLSPVFLDFAADPHFLVLGDTETGKSNLLHLIADGIVTRFSLEQARLIVVDYRRSLLEAADTGHRIGYAPSSAAAVALLNDAREALVSRLPPADLTADQLRNRSWWRGSDLFVIVDDYDLVAGATNPLLPLVDLLPQAREIGLHLILARSAGGAGRAMFEPVIQRLREMGSTALLMSASKDEGPDLRRQASNASPRPGLPGNPPRRPPPRPNRLRHHPPGGRPALASGGNAEQWVPTGCCGSWQNAICHTTGQHVRWWRSISAVGDVVRPLTGEPGRQEPDPGLRRLRVAESGGGGQDVGGGLASSRRWWGSGRWFRGGGGGGRRHRGVNESGKWFRGWWGCAGCGWQRVILARSSVRDRISLWRPSARRGGSGSGAGVAGAGAAAGEGAGARGPGCQWRRRPWGTTMAPMATRAAVTSAPPVTERATVRVSELSARGRGTRT